MLVLRCSCQAEEGSAPALSIVAADPAEGCQLSGTLPPNTALLVARGNCTFAQKAALAAQSGAAAVIVRNTLKGMYLSATNMSVPDPTLQVSECDYDCSLKSIGVQVRVGWTIGVVGAARRGCTTPAAD